MRPLLQLLLCGIARTSQLSLPSIQVPSSQPHSCSGVGASLALSGA